VHIFIKYPSKYFVSYISKMIKGRSSRVLRKEFPYLKKWCGDYLWAPSCYHGSVGSGWDVVEKYISAHNTYEHNRRVYRDCGMGGLCLDSQESHLHKHLYNPRL